MGLVVAVFGLAAAAFAQAQLTPADITRLQDAVYDAGSDVSRLRERDARRAEALQRELDELREEVIYLKVKLRKESNVSRAEYSNLRDRIEQLRTDARGEPARAAAPAAPAPPRPAVDERLSATEIPVGTEFDVRLQSRLNSGTARVEDRFDATTSSPTSEADAYLCPPVRSCAASSTPSRPPPEASIVKASSRSSSTGSRSTAGRIRSAPR